MNKLSSCQPRHLRRIQLRTSGPLMALVVSTAMSVFVKPLPSQPLAPSEAKSAQPPLDVTKLEGIPRDFLLYRFFFTHVQQLDAFAERIQSNMLTAAIAAKTPNTPTTQPSAHPIAVSPPAARPVAATGAKTLAGVVIGDGSDARHHIKMSAGLTDAEEVLVKSIAARCLADVVAFDKTGFETVKGIARKYPAGVKLSAADQTTVDQLEAQREKIVTDYVAQLKSGMGARRFAVLHAFVVGSEAGSIRHRELPVVRTK